MPNENVYRLINCNLVFGANYILFTIHNSEADLMGLLDVCDANQPIGTLLGLHSNPRRKTIAYDSAGSSGWSVNS